MSVSKSIISSECLTVRGRVQGVGFRPFVYRLANQHSLAGSVINRSGEVLITLQGPAAAIDDFAKALLDEAPPLAKPKIAERHKVDAGTFERFEIQASSESERADIHVPPDYFTCPDCLAEMRDPKHRRFNYPFTNCTQCGPRYTLITAMPYDRPNTSMAGFELCDDCDSEYQDPLDRRFHAQPLACPVCGPVLQYVDADKDITGNEASLDACVQALARGQVVAVKGVGGYHLLCDAQSELAVQRLRKRKHRPGKPLAVMFPMQGEDELDQVRQNIAVDAFAAELLIDPARPIVLLPRLPAGQLADNIAPGLGEIGVFLPYSPLHHLLLEHFSGPLVATSGNLSGEPVLTDNLEATDKLQHIADSFLHHDRPIVRPADDPVKRVIGGRGRLMRIGRGVGPLELTLPGTLKQPVLAVGGHLKATVALAWENRVVVSPHISDLDTVRGMAVFEQVIADLQALYQVKAQRLLCDAHPGYNSHRWANEQSLPLTTSWHHHAHASAVAGEAGSDKNWLMLCWDGVGLGADGTLWGGETFVGSPGRWQHVAGLRPFHLPGADKAGREPWRSAAAIRWETGDLSLPAIEQAELALAAWQKRINCPQSSAAGRLFDAAANLVLQVDWVSYEGEGPMRLEAIADDSDELIELPMSADDNGVLRIDWSVLLPMLQDRSIPAATRAAMFHNSLANNIIAQARYFAERVTVDAIGLGGGVFQNRRLAESVMQLADQAGIEVFLPEVVPVNDGGLSYGQVIEYLFR